MNYSYYCNYRNHDTSDQIGEKRKGRRCIVYSKEEINIYLCHYKQWHEKCFYVLRRLNIFKLIRIIFNY